MCSFCDRHCRGYAVSVPIDERLGVETLVKVIMYFDNDDIDEYDEMVCALIGRGSYAYALKKLCLDLKNIENPPALPSIKEPSVLELKALPSYLCYAFLGDNNTLSVLFLQVCWNTN